ncbi:hypothetical protein [Amycolatopsis taiwanensis]|uniref:hypothetical protein n=1 Tax=Amycolatopsis taiwanensis TaxID=342230 RepID=UPI0004841404|nr:hypothetical protein [Amycolatopsis taiwanensis]
MKHHNIEVSAAQIAEMRAWIADCQWADIDNAGELTDREVIAGIGRHFDGGVAGFLQTTT